MMQENVRLMYVAMTRARDHLFVCLHHHEKKMTPPKETPRILARLRTLPPSVLS